MSDAQIAIVAILSFIVPFLAIATVGNSMTEYVG